MPIDVRLQPVKLYIAASASSWNYSVAEGDGWTMTPVVSSSDDTTCRLN